MNLDTKSFLFKNIVLEVSGWKHRISQRINDFASGSVLTGHPLLFDECTSSEEVLDEDC